MPGEFYCKLFLRKSYILLKVEYNLSYINTSFVIFFVRYIHRQLKPALAVVYHAAGFQLAHLG